MFILVSGASGSGKSTIISRVLKHFEGKIALLPSSTSRAKREGEVEGESYFYLTREEFEAAIAREEFIEYQKVHANGNYYGVHRGRFEDYNKRFPLLIKDVDVLGVQSIVSQGFDVVTIYIDVPDNEALRERLRLRGDSAEEIDLRMARKEFEDGFKEKYDYIVENRDLEKATKKVISIVEKECKKRKIALK